RYLGKESPSWLYIRFDFLQVNCSRGRPGNLVRPVNTGRWQHNRKLGRHIASAVSKDFFSAKKGLGRFGGPAPIFHHAKSLYHSMCQAKMRTRCGHENLFLSEDVKRSMKMVRPERFELPTF